MEDKRLAYCEIWISTNNIEYRVSACIPEEVEIPEGFLCAKPTNEEHRICVSPWYISIIEARERAFDLKDYLQHNHQKVLFYFEIRPTRVGDLHSTSKG